MPGRPEDRDQQKSNENANGSALWHVECDALLLCRLLDAMGPGGELSDVDGDKWDRAAAARVGSRTLLGLDGGRIAGLVPPLRVRLPQTPWDAPDFLPLGPRHLASARLRAVLEPWSEWIDWLPVEVMASDAAGRAADYRLMRLFAHRPAFDLAASGLPADADWIAIAVARRLVLRPDAANGPPIFVAEDRPGSWFVADVVAEHVMRAGCTGIEFLHPEDEGHLGRPHRIRGPDGVLVKGA